MKVSGVTIKADSPDSCLLTVYGPEQMVRKLRTLRSGLWEGHDRTCVDKTEGKQQQQRVNTLTLMPPNTSITENTPMIKTQTNAV